MPTAFILTRSELQHACPRERVPVHFALYRRADHAQENSSRSSRVYLAIFWIVLDEQACCYARGGGTSAQDQSKVPKRGALRLQWHTRRAAKLSRHRQLAAGAVMKAMRRYTFTPYREGMGPRFVLATYETNQHDSRGCDYIGYKLTMLEAGVHTVLFEGSDFNAGPMHAIDSIGAAEGLMRFLTLRPGDTDAEYFDKYTPAQLAFCSDHAEALSVEVDARWRDPETGGLKKRYQGSRT